MLIFAIESDFPKPVLQFWLPGVLCAAKVALTWLTASQKHGSIERATLRRLWLANRLSEQLGLLIINIGRNHIEEHELLLKL